MDKIDLKSLEEELAKLDPADLQYLSQLLVEDPPAVKRVIKNVLEEPIPEATQEKIKIPITTKTFPTNTTTKKQKQKISETIRPHPAE